MRYSFLVCGFLGGFVFFIVLQQLEKLQYLFHIGKDCLLLSTGGYTAFLCGIPPYQPTFQEGLRKDYGLLKVGVSKFLGGIKNTITLDIIVSIK